MKFFKSRITVIFGLVVSGLEVLGDVGGVKVVHLVDHADRRGDDGVGAQGTGTLAQAQPQVEDGLGMDDVEHAAVTALITAVGEDHVVLGGWIESDGSDGTGRHDKAIY